MEKSKTTAAHEPPLLTLCILLGVPGFLGWILPCFLLRSIRRGNAEAVAPLIDQKYEEIYQICENGNELF